MDRFRRFSGTEGIRANLKRHSVRGALFTASGQGLDFVMRLVTIGVLARLLLPEDFGLVAMVLALTGILESVKDLGLTTATMQRAELSHELVSNLFWVNTLAGVGFAAVFWIAAPWIADFYNDPRLVDITMVLALMFVWSGVSAQHEALLIRQLRQGDLAIIRFVANLFSFGAAVVLAVNGASYWALVWREVVRTAVIAVGVWIRCPWLPGLPRKAEGTAGLLHFGKDFSYSQLLHAIVNNLDRLLVGKLFGASILGDYRLAHQTVVATIDQLSGPIGSVANPGLSMLQKDPARYKRYFEKVVFLIALCTMPFSIYATLYSTQLTAALLGGGWAEAIPFFAIFAASAFFRPVHGALSSLLISRGESRRFLRMMVGNKLVFLGCLVIGCYFGPIGIALVHFISPLIVFMPNVGFAMRGSPVTARGFFEAMRDPALASLATGIAMFSLQAIAEPQSGIAQLALGVVGGAIVYPAALFALPGSRSRLRQLLADLRTSFPVRLKRFAAGREEG